METKINEQTVKLDFSPNETTVAVLAVPPKETKKIVLLIHGFMSNKESETNLELTKRFLAKGIATVRLDLFGHGESSGPFQKLTLSRCLHQVEGLIAWIKEKGYEEISMVGSSFGGLIAIHTAAKHKDLISLALKCPVSNYPPLWHDRLGRGGMDGWKRDDLFTFIFDDQKARLEYSFYEDLLKANTYSDAAHIKTPTLIVHGDADDDVPVDQSIRLFDTLRLARPDKELVLISGADHGFEKPADFGQMIDKIENWVVATTKTS
jgi:pimeloyl-ACP methyl ester carboxylesterase